MRQRLRDFYHIKIRRRKKTQLAQFFGGPFDGEYRVLSPDLKVNEVVVLPATPGAYGKYHGMHKYVYGEDQRVHWVGADYQKD